MSANVQKSLETFQTSHVYFMFSTFGQMGQDYYTFLFSVNCTFTIHQIGRGSHLDRNKPFIFPKFVTKFLFILFTDGLREKIGIPIIKPRWMKEIYLGYYNPSVALYVSRKLNPSIFNNFHIKPIILTVTAEYIWLICPICTHLVWGVSNLEQLDTTWRLIFVKHGSLIYLSDFLFPVALEKCDLFVHRFVFAFVRNMNFRKILKHSKYEPTIIAWRTLNL